MTRVFIDFDGTITRRDVGDAMFETFGGKRCTEYIRAYREEEISAVECFRHECDACGIVDKCALDSFLDSQEVDQSFSSFVHYCNEHGFQYCVVSDGMDYYIKRILARQGLGHVPFLSNVLELVPSGGSSQVRLAGKFPYTDEVCDRCACCKRDYMLSVSADDDNIVYIGEGYSDRCPARYADVVFAKDELLAHCRRENIACFEYRIFGDIMKRIEQLLAENHGRASNSGLRKRRQAELARREIFLGG